MSCGHRHKDEFYMRYTEFAAVALLAAVLAIAALPADAADASAEGFSLEVSADGTVTGWTGSLPGELTIPVRVGETTVKSITEGAFYGSDGIGKLIFEEGSQLESIGKDAFRDSGLKGDLVLPDSL